LTVLCPESQHERQAAKGYANEVGVSDAKLRRPLPKEVFEDFILKKS